MFLEYITGSDNKRLIYQVIQKTVKPDKDIFKGTNWKDYALTLKTLLICMLANNDRYAKKSCLRH